MEKRKSIFDQYFNQYAASKTLSEKRFRLFNQRLDDIISDHLAASDSLHPNFLILDFILFADDYLSKRNPISTNDLKEIAQNIAEQYTDEAENCRLEAFNLSTAYFDFEPVAFEYAVSHGTDLQDCLNARPSLSHKLLGHLFKTRASDNRQLADIKEQQVSNFQNWLKGRQARLFFECYRSLEQYSERNNVAARQATKPIRGFILKNE